MHHFTNGDETKEPRNRDRNMDRDIRARMKHPIHGFGDRAAIGLYAESVLLVKDVQKPEVASNSWRR